MSRTPEEIISKPRKFLHDLLVGAGNLAIVAALVIGLTGGVWIGAVILGFIAFGIASKIKFRWVKRGEVGVYE